MKIFIAFLISLPSLALATNPITWRLDTAIVNLTSTFPTNPQLTGFPNSILKVDVNNGTALELEMNCSASSTPSSDSANGIYLPASLSYSTPSSLPPFTSGLGKYCWFRTKSGTASTGIIEAIGWGF